MKCKVRDDKTAPRKFPDCRSGNQCGDCDYYERFGEPFGHCLVNDAEIFYQEGACIRFISRKEVADTL